MTPNQPAVSAESGGRDRERIERYVRRYHARHKQEKWPTVREVAHALRLRQSVIEEEAEVLPLMKTEWNVHPRDPLGEHSVEICE